MQGEHHYKVSIKWTGNTGAGTAGYTAYSRAHLISAEDKEPIAGSSDPAFRGDRSRYNPEELLLASLSSCHMLWYLHLCAEEGVVVLQYSDHATGLMAETAEGGGHFTQATLNPMVTVSEAGMADKAILLHEKANRFCFIATSVNFPVRHQPKVNF
jgi:organic hydroperoxide reductase OsmC/OhrA